MIQHKKNNPQIPTRPACRFFDVKALTASPFFGESRKTPTFPPREKNLRRKLTQTKTNKKMHFTPAPWVFWAVSLGWMSCDGWDLPRPFWQIPKFPDSEPNQNNQTNFTNQTKKTCIDLVSAKKNTYTPCFFFGRVHSAFFLAAQCKIPSIQDQTQRFQWLSPQLWWLLAALVTKGGKRNTGPVGFGLFFWLSFCLVGWERGRSIVSMIFGRRSSIMSGNLTIWRLETSVFPIQ